MKTDPRCPEPGGGSAPFVVRRLRAGRGRGRAGPEEFPRCPSATMGSAPYRSLLPLLPLLLSPLSLLPAVCGELRALRGAGGSFALRSFALRSFAHLGAELLLNAFFFSYR